MASSSSSPKSPHSESVGETDQAVKQAAMEPEWMDEFMEATRFGKVDALRKMLQDKADDPSVVNAYDGFQRTALHVAAQEGQCECIRYLLTKGASPKVPNKAGDLPIHRAAAATLPSSLKCCQILVERGGKTTLTVKNKNGQTPAVLALDRGNVSIAKYLKSQLIQDRRCVDAETAESEKQLRVTISKLERQLANEREHRTMVEENFRQLQQSLVEANELRETETRVLSDKLDKALSESRTFQDRFELVKDQNQLLRDHLEGLADGERLEMDSNGVGGEIPSVAQPVAEKEWAQSMACVCSKLEDEVHSLTGQLRKSRDIVNMLKAHIRSMNRGASQRKGKGNGGAKPKNGAGRESSQICGPHVQVALSSLNQRELEKEITQTAIERDVVRSELETEKRHIASLEQEAEMLRVRMNEQTRVIEDLNAAWEQEKVRSRAIMDELEATKDERDEEMKNAEQARGQTKLLQSRLAILQRNERSPSIESASSFEKENASAVYPYNVQSHHQEQQRQPLTTSLSENVYRGNGVEFNDKGMTAFDPCHTPGGAANETRARRLWFLGVDDDAS